MLQPRSLIAVFALLAAGAQPVIAAGPPTTTVHIDTGQVAGRVEADTLAFRGIPYAAPPVGPLRWMPPEPARAWHGVRNATRFGDACPQGPEHKESWAQVGPQSEDCLFINVWRPAKAGNYPVMVFLHGGGFTYGAAGVPLYDGGKLARRGAVIVTMNYRLGRLGFFAHPALTREHPTGPLGNYGVMDQVAALRWVRRNIARFSGDVHNITLFGESAGAGVVQTLMGSPVATGLFDKAISESGAGGAALFPIRGGQINAEALGARWTEGLGLHDPTPGQLRAIPVADVIKGRGFPFIDGKIVIASPGDPFHRGSEMRIPLMIGSNSNEGSLIGNNPALAKPVLGNEYPALLGAYEKRPGATATDAAIDLVEDATSILPSLSIADMHAANGAKAYAYYFTQVPASERAGTLGAQHGGEIEYLFGNWVPEHHPDAEDEQVSRLTGDYWVQFARSGDPNVDNLPHWPAVAGQHTSYLVIGAMTHATALTPLEEKVQALALDHAVQQWSATAAMSPKP